MKTNPLSTGLLAGSALIAAALAQTAAPPAKPTPPAQRLTAKEIRVLPFCREFKEVKFKPNDREVPDELRVTVSPGSIHLYGRKKDNTAKIRGRNSGHLGKVVLLPPAARAGTLTVKAPTADEVTFYFAVLELAETLETKPIKLATGKTYDWAIESKDGETTLRVAEGRVDLAVLRAGESQVRGAGFAATVRAKGNEADLSIVLP